MSVIEFPKLQDIPKIVKTMWEIQHNIMIVEDPVPFQMQITSVSYENIGEQDLMFYHLMHSIKQRNISDLTSVYKESLL